MFWSQRFFFLFCECVYILCMTMNIYLFKDIYIFLLKFFFFVNINNVNINGAAAHIGPPFSKFILSTFVLYTKVLNFIHVSYWEIALVSVFDDILFFKLMKNIVILLDLNVETFTVLIPATKCLSLSLSLSPSLCRHLYSFIYNPRHRETHIHCRSRCHFYHYQCHAACK